MPLPVVFASKGHERSTEKGETLDVYQPYAGRKNADCLEMANMQSNQKAIMEGKTCRDRKMML